ncbi:hypothetical protein LINGRAPRIM_LOCUS3180, partial [Linum grandiflorum]
FQNLRSRLWEVNLFHTYREASYAADYLTNLVHSLNFDVHLFDAPDGDLSYWLQYDLLGVSLSKQVLVLNNI